MFGSSSVTSVIPFSNKLKASDIFFIVICFHCVVLAAFPFHPSILSFVPPTHSRSLLVISSLCDSTSSLVCFVEASHLYWFHSLHLNFWNIGTFLDTMIALWLCFLPHNIIAWEITRDVAVLSVAFLIELNNWWLVQTICVGEQTALWSVFNVDIPSCSIGFNKEAVFGLMKTTCNLMMETVCTSEMSVSINLTTWRYIPED
jgi:hypothetical protein